MDNGISDVVCKVRVTYSVSNWNENIGTVIEDVLNDEKI